MTQWEVKRKNFVVCVSVFKLCLLALLTVGPDLFGDLRSLGVVVGWVVG